MSTRSKLTDRVNLRVSPRVKADLLKAAKLSGRSLTDFILDSAVASAEEAFATRKSFALSPKDWRKFNELLDAPARNISALRELLRKKSVFES